jgi:hypothetical protein
LGETPLSIAALVQSLFKAVRDLNSQSYDTAHAAVFFTSAAQSKVAFGVPSLTLVHHARTTTKSFNRRFVS